MIQKIYDALSEKYGPQNWWPVTEPGDVIPTYSGGPKDDSQKFEVIVGAILTQNTSWKNVEKAIIELNKNRLIDASRLSAVSLSELASCIKPAGYYNQKAERLKIIAGFILDNDLSSLEPIEPEKLRDMLLGLKGIGPETADSIMLYALNKKIFVIDAYTRRVFSRIGFLGEAAKYDDWQRLFHSEFRGEVKAYQEFHALIVEHAKRYCRKKPLCDACFLKQHCSRNL